MRGDNGSPNVLLYAGDLANNGITSSLRSLLHSSFADRHDITVVFRDCAGRSADFIADTAGRARFVPQGTDRMGGFAGRIVRKLYVSNRISFESFDTLAAGIYRRELQRRFGGMRFDAVVQFTGYDRDWVYLLGKADARKVLFAHNDVIREFETKRNVDLEMMRWAYRAYDAVAVVSDDLVPMARGIGGDEANVCVVPNLFDYDRVRRLAREPLGNLSCGQSSRPLNEVVGFFDGNAPVLMTIGRFAPEKQHDLLLQAFDGVHAARPEARLVIVGGYSKYGSYQRTFELLQTLECRDSVALVMGMPNPYALLSRARGFILPSAYEGLGLVLLEADALGVPAVSTDVVGPRGFMASHHGRLVANSLEGVRQGLLDLVDRRVPPMNVDYAAYNEAALERYCGLFQTGSSSSSDAAR